MQSYIQLGNWLARGKGENAKMQSAHCSFVQHDKPEVPTVIVSHAQSLEQCVCALQVVMAVCIQVSHSLLYSQPSFYMAHLDHRLDCSLCSLHSLPLLCI